MTGSAEAPGYRTGVIWAVLAVLLVLGTVASASVVYGVVGLFTNRSYVLNIAVVGVGAFGAVFVLLLIAGIMYRIDRLRGVPHRRVELFE
jgi:hypothetical protein